MKKLAITLTAALAAWLATPAFGQDTPTWSEENYAPIWGPTFTLTAAPSETGVKLEWTGHAALNAESRRIDTLDIMVKFEDKKSEKHRQEGVTELKSGQIELEGEWKEIRLSYKTRRPGTVPSKNPRVSCRLQAKKVTLPAFVIFESYKEGPRCKIEQPAAES